MCTRLRICQDVVMLCQVKATGSGHRLNLVVREGAVTPSSLMIKGDYDSTYGYGGGESNGHFENDLRVFNKQF